jgi:hydroxyacylglutathione hydrolase
MVALLVEPVACLRDNYAYLVRGRDDTAAWVVDPSEAPPVIDALASRGLAIAGVLATHHHLDHVGGIAGLRDRFGAFEVAGHSHDRGRIPLQTQFVDAPLHAFAPTELSIAGHRLHAAHIPGHTLGAIAWYLAAQDHAPGHVFTGDTLFAAGCGRLFEGTPAQMLGSLRMLCELPDDTQMWFGHEYTAANLRFAAVTEPDNAAIARRLEGLPERTTPTTVALERATNPFVRSADADELARRRTAKDTFR